MRQMRIVRGILAALEAGCLKHEWFEKCWMRGSEDVRRRVYTGAVADFHDSSLARVHYGENIDY